MSEGFEDADPLALAPFVATGLIGGTELLRAQLGRRARVVLLLAAGGFLFGVPMGIAADPLPAAFAVVAYGATLVAFAAGYREPRDRDLVLVRVLAVLAVPLAVYAILQIVAPLTPWDEVWLQDVSFTSIGEKEEGTLRAFGTLNSPGTLAVVLGLAAVALLTRRRFGVVSSAVLLVALAGVSVSLVRSVWIAIAFVLVALLVVAPGRFTRRVVLVVVIGAAAAPFVVSGSPVTGTVGERASTLGNLGEDTSAQARLTTPILFIPALLSEPLGLGIGQAGEASRLGSGVLRATDNALLSIAVQSGFVGLSLVAAAVVLGLLSSLRGARRRKGPNDLAVFACLALLAVLALSGDVLYGVSGAAIWYFIGFAVRGDDLAARART